VSQTRDRALVALAFCPPLAGSSASSLRSAKRSKAVLVQLRNLFFSPLSDFTLIIHIRGHMSVTAWRYVMEGGGTEGGDTRRRTGRGPAGRRRPSSRRDTKRDVPPSCLVLLRQPTPAATAAAAANDASL
jgi:hypothetical protein